MSYAKYVWIKTIFGGKFPPIIMRSLQVVARRVVGGLRKSTLIAVFLLA
jgi:hypothetical protein